MVVSLVSRKLFFLMEEGRLSWNWMVKHLTLSFSRLLVRSMLLMLRQNRRSSRTRDWKLNLRFSHNLTWFRLTNFQVTESCLWRLPMSSRSSPLRWPNLMVNQKRLTSQRTMCLIMDREITSMTLQDSFFYLEDLQHLTQFSLNYNILSTAT